MRNINIREIGQFNWVVIIQCLVMLIIQVVQLQITPFYTSLLPIQEPEALGILKQLF